MHNAIPLSLAALIAVAIIVIGCFYLMVEKRLDALGVNIANSQPAESWNERIADVTFHRCTPSTIHTYLVKYEPVACLLSV
jgi:hypothetical protein